MAKRGYKLQEFMAHSGNVNCLKIGKKACRLYITGGDDHKVNVWTIGKPESLMSLSGHTSPVESVAFDSAEVLVLAGTSSGAIKQWDLEEAKMVRTLSGHRANCTAVEFHPFGEFFASGSSDTNLRVWDIRKKGCIHTYKGHTQGIGTIKFSPDGRWVVSGGLDNVVKVWDLTAGKLLHDFTFHEGHIRSLDFHPLEFLLATGSADRTVKFWDLETFELIGSTRPEASGVRAVTFHPDGRTLFAGLEDSLKVYSWEPVIRHDAVDIGWSTLGDLCIHDGKLLGCSYYQNSVGVWVADISHIEPYGDASQNDHTDQKFNLKQQGSSERLGTMFMNSNIRARSPDYDTKDIYVDSSGGKPVSQKVESWSPPKVPSRLETKEIKDQVMKKQSHVFGTPPKSNDVINKSFTAPSIVPRDSPDEKDSSNATIEPITFSRTKRGMLLRPANARRPSSTKSDMERLPMAVESGNKLDSPADSTFEIKTVSEDTSPSFNSVTERLANALSPQTPSSPETSDKFSDASEDSNSIKVVNGVTVVRGRTRSLVEKFEKREPLDASEDQAAVTTSNLGPEIDKTPTITSNLVVPEVDRTPTIISSHVVPEVDETPTLISSHADPEINQTSSVTSSRFIQEVGETPAIVSTNVHHEVEKTPTMISGHVDSKMNKTSSVTSNRVIQAVDETPAIISRRRVAHEVEKPPTIASRRVVSPGPRMMSSRVAPEEDKTSDFISSRVNREIDTARTINSGRVSPEVDRTYDRSGRVSPETTKRRTAGSGHGISEVSNRARVVKSPERNRRIVKSPERNRRIVKSPELNKTPSRRIPVDRTRNVMSSRVIHEVVKKPTFIASRLFPEVDTRPTFVSSHLFPEEEETPIVQIEEPPQVSTNVLNSSNNSDVTEDLMQTHEVFLNNLRSRLTKLQVVRHFWERGDFNGAIGAMKKLPDHSVQADVISILMDKMDTLNLDLFSSLLPVLLGLLNSKTDRHATLSMEILLKLVAVFGPMIQSTVTSRRGLGVDLHAEQRRECCNQCSLHLQQIKKILPLLARRGGLVAKSALELNLVLQES